MKIESTPCAVIHRRLSARGFRDLTVDQACSVESWMRLNPALNALLFLLCCITGSAPGLLVLAFFFAIGMVSSVHPFEYFYTEIIRSLEQSPALPHSPPLRRVVFAIGMAGCLFSAWAFSSGHPAWGYLVTGIMTASTALLALTHICIPSLVYGLVRRGLLGVRGAPRS
jgi:hypothetical protein